MRPAIRFSLRPLLIAAAALLPPPAMAFVFTANAVEGRVVDASSGRPLEGVLVVANWQLEGGVDTGIPRGQLQILETTTDASGTFRLPSWGPKVSVAGHASFKWPNIVLFKPGYQYRTLANAPRSGSQYTTTSDWNGKTIALAAVPDLPKYAKEFDALNREIDSIGVRSGDACAWRELPAALRTLAVESERLHSLGIRSFSEAVEGLKSNEEYFAKQGCGSVAAFLERNRK